MARVLATNPDLAVVDTGPLGSMGLLRFNQLQPPFDNVKMRQAILGVVDQGEFTTALAGDANDWKICASFFTCNTPMAKNAGAAALTGKRDFDKARRLIAEAGYTGEKIVILDAVDLLTNHIHALVTFDLFKKLGLNVELATSDWGTVVTRRASKKPVGEGGWSVFGTDFEVPKCSIRGSTRRFQLMATKPGSAGQQTTRSKHYERNGSRPATARPARRSPPRYMSAPSNRYPTFRPGSTCPKTAYRKNVSGIIVAPALFMWNIKKS
jgi:peptide/nickel transport system substrate-binding protein